MIAILEGLALGAVVLTLVYLLVSIYARSVQREKLEKQFDEGTEFGTREEFVARGMQAYAHSLRRRLILLVYIVPAAAIIGIVWLVNSN